MGLNQKKQGWTGIPKTKEKAMLQRADAREWGSRTVMLFKDLKEEEVEEDRSENKVRVEADPKSPGFESPTAHIIYYICSRGVFFPLSFLNSMTFALHQKGSVHRTL